MGPVNIVSKIQATNFSKVNDSKKIITVSISPYKFGGTSIPQFSNYNKINVPCYE